MVIDITALDTITEIVKKEMLLQVNVHIFLIFFINDQRMGYPSSSQIQDRNLGNTHPTY